MLTSKMSLFLRNLKRLSRREKHTTNVPVQLDEP
jgi:hypothetical protein